VILLKVLSAGLLKKIVVSFVMNLKHKIMKNIPVSQNSEF
jgi:hypothetical protein